METKNYVRIVDYPHDTTQNGRIGLWDDVTYDLQHPSGTLPELWHIVFADGDAMWVQPEYCEKVTLPVTIISDDESDEGDYYAVDSEALTPLQRVLEVARILKIAEANQDKDNSEQAG